jgi:hypothetical protein
MVPIAHSPLHCGPSTPTSHKENLHRQVRLLGRLPSHIAHSASAAVQSVIVVAGIAYIELRLTFEGSPNPPTWCAFSEMVTDLSNEIPLCDDWDPRPQADC